MLTLMGRRKMFELTFDDQNKDKYDMIYEALIGSGQKGFEDDVVTFIDVLRKMRELGKINDDVQLKRAKIPMYIYDHAGTISLTKAEMTCLKSNFEKCKFQTWTLELAQEIKEWLNGIKDTNSTDKK